MRFLNRVWNELAPKLTPAKANRLLTEVLFELGEADPRPTGLPFPDFYRALRDNVSGSVALECLRSDWRRSLVAFELYCSEVDESERHAFSTLVERALGLAQVDLGIEWKGSVFVSRGARLLDDRLLMDPLEWLGDNQELSKVRRCFEHALSLYRESNGEENKLKDAVANAYESLEAMAKVVMEADKDLSAVQEKLASKLDLGKHFKAILHEYIEFANLFRHAEPLSDSPRPQRPPLTDEGVEFFVYLTGLFLRLTLRKKRRLPARGCISS